MGVFSKSWTFAFASAGLLTFSQAPEFSQQYKQRLGGGINELATVVSQFEKDAADQGLTRDQAIDALKESSEDFPQVRGVSIEKIFRRYENLLAQRQVMENANPIMQPLHLIQYPDAKILSGTLNAYRPGVQLTLEGLFWGLLGFGLIGGIGRAPISVARFRARRKREPKVTADPWIDAVE
ncbi:MAG: DUF2937 family protein [Pseudomonadota bacterium]